MNNKIGKLAGISLLLMAVIAIIAYGVIHTKLITDPFINETLISNLGLFKVELVLWYMIILLDLIVSIALYHCFKTENKRSLIMAGLRIIYTIFLFVAVFSLSKVLRLDDHLVDYVDAFEQIWAYGLIIFGLHLIFIPIAGGDNLPKLLKGLLSFAGLAYILVEGLPLISIQISWLEPVLVLPMTIGEIRLSIWLIAKKHR